MMAASIRSTSVSTSDRAETLRFSSSVIVPFRRLRQLGKSRKAQSSTPGCLAAGQRTVARSYLCSTAIADSHISLVDPPHFSTGNGQNTKRLGDPERGQGALLD